MPGRQNIGIGTVANDDTGDTARAAFDKVNDNFIELYRNPPYNVVNYGALGDNSTDDKAAFQSAIDAAASDGGGIVLVPAGAVDSHYVIKSTLTMKRNVHLVGVSGHSGGNSGDTLNPPGIYFDPASSDTMIDLAAPATGYNYLDGVKIRGLNFRGATDATIGLDAQLPDTMVIEDCKFRGFGTAIQIGGGIHSTLRHLKLRDNTTAGIHFNKHASWSSTTIVCDQVYINNAGAASTWCVTSAGDAARDCSFRNCVFENSANGVQLQKGNMWKFFDCHMEAILASGIGFEVGVNGTTAQGNLDGTLIAIYGGRYSVASAALSGTTFLKLDDLFQAQVFGADCPNWNTVLSTTADSRQVIVHGLTPRNNGTAPYSINDWTAISGSLLHPRSGGLDPQRWYPAALDGVSLNARAFGAFGDGTTDDKTALQAAIDAAVTAGMPLTIPRGTYVITAALELKSDLVIQGAGRGDTIIKLTTAAVNALQNSSAAVVQRCDIRDLMVQTNQNSAIGIDLLHCHHCRVINCRIEGTSGITGTDGFDKGIRASGTTAVGDAQGNIISRCRITTFDGAGSRAISLESADAGKGANFAQVRDNELHSTNGTCIYVQESDDTSMRGNMMITGATGLDIQGSQTGVTSIGDHFGVALSTAYTNSSASAVIIDAENKTIEIGSVKFLQGTGSPETAIAAPVGSIYCNVSGGNDTTTYHKATGTGNTGWRAITTAAP